MICKSIISALQGNLAFNTMDKSVQPIEALVNRFNESKELGVKFLVRQVAQAMPEIQALRARGMTHAQIYEILNPLVKIDKPFTFKYYEQLYIRARKMHLTNPLFNVKFGSLADKSSTLPVVNIKPKRDSATTNTPSESIDTPRDIDQQGEYRFIMDEVKKASVAASKDWGTNYLKKKRESKK